MKTFTKRLINPKRDQWGPILKRFVGKPGIKGLEIGSFEGQSACWFMDNVLTDDSSNLTCVDHWKSWPEARDLFLSNTREYGEKISSHVSSSMGFMSRRLGAGVKDVYDFVYIDGDHNASVVLIDAVLAWVLLKEGGVLIFDDASTSYEELNKHKMVCPRVAVQSFLAVRPADYEILHKGYQVALRKVKATNFRK